MTDESPVSAADCTSMIEVRDAIDMLDQRIVTLLSERMRYIEAAARIKQDRDAVRDDDRKAEVIANARAAALKTGFPPDLAGEIYELLVERSIAYEFDRFDE